jgi:4'-phosphopantetheinyl transferase EntD
MRGVSLALEGRTFYRMYSPIGDRSNSDADEPGGSLRHVEAIFSPLHRPGVLPDWAISYAIQRTINTPVPNRSPLSPHCGRTGLAEGRYCAASALRLIGASCWQAHIDAGTAGEPIWPHGYTGSIAHTPDLSVAAVAPVGRALSVGIDLEFVVHPETAGHMSRSVLHACETRLRAPGMDGAAVFTVALSSKRALFKCLYPMVVRRFEYRDVAVRHIDAVRGSLVVELLTSLGNGFHRGRRLNGRFASADGLVRAAFVFEPEHGGARQAE